MVMDDSTAKRFWSYVDQSGGPEACWPWTASTFRKGYGQFTHGGHRSTHVGAHRVAYELTHGPIGDKKILVCHTCDNPPCCNPAHLFLGKHKANSDDALAKLRFPNTLKLNHAEVEEIRCLYAAGGISQQAIADRFGIHQTQVSRIVRRQHWKKPQ